MKSPSPWAHAKGDEAVAPRVHPSSSTETTAPAGSWADGAQKAAPA